MAKCSVRVTVGSWYYADCSRKAVVERDGKPYCKIHDPEYRKEKAEERHTKYESEKCKKCGHHFDYSFYGFCPLCGTKRHT